MCLIFGWFAPSPTGEGGYENVPEIRLYNRLVCSLSLWERAGVRAKA